MITYNKKLLKIEVVLFLFFLLITILFNLDSSAHKYFNESYIVYNLHGVFALLTTFYYGVFFWVCIYFPTLWLIQLIVLIRIKCFKKYLKLFLLVTVFYLGSLFAWFSLYSINQQESYKENLEGKNKRVYGDWFVYSLNSLEDKNSQEFFDYTEIYFSKNKMYRYSNLSGILSPINYQVSKDSLFYYSKDELINNKEFVGSLNSRKKDTLYIVNDKDTLILYKLYSKNKLMSNYIGIDDNGFKKFDKSNEVFLKYFLDRMQSFFEAVK